MFKKVYPYDLFIFFLLFFSSMSFAQKGGKGGMPPAKVVAAKIEADIIIPSVEYVGTVFYPEVSDVASEASGRVDAVSFEEGRKIKKGDLLAELNTDLLEKAIQAKTALYSQVQFDLEKGKKDLQRMENLYKEESVAEQIYDEHRFRVQGLKMKTASIKADVERLEVEYKKMAVNAPFTGIVIKRTVDRGEWLSPGSIVATIARNDRVDIIVDVPEKVIRFVSPGTQVKLIAAGMETEGKIFVIIPRGEISTRTFPVKIRIKNRFSLKEGMEAKVSIPSGEKKDALIVPRDAVITMNGKAILFVVEKSKAKMIPVKILGYKGMMVGVYAEGLKEGMKAVIKGNERLRDGDAVEVMP